MVESEFSDRLQLEPTLGQVGKDILREIGLKRVANEYQNTLSCTLRLLIGFVLLLKHPGSRSEELYDVVVQTLDVHLKLSNVVNIL